MTRTEFEYFPILSIEAVVVFGHFNNKDRKEIPCYVNFL